MSRDEEPRTRPTPLSAPDASSSRPWTRSFHPNAHDRRKTDEWFRILVEVIAEGACITDRADRIVYLNSRLARIFCCSEKDVIGRPLAEFIEGFDHMAAPNEGVGDERSHWTERQTSLIRQDGKRTFAQFSVRPFFDGHENFQGALVVVTDLTEKRHTEQIISKLTAAIEQNPVGVLITDKQGKIEYVNRQLCKQTGYGASELLGMTPRLLKTAKTPPETFRNLWNALVRGEEWSGNLCDRKKSGEIYWVHEFVFPIRSDSGEDAHYVAFQEDITARIRAEQELRESEAKYSLLVENALTGIYVVQDHRLVYVNPKFADIFGYAPKEMDDMPFLQLVHQSEKERINDFLAVDRPRQPFENGQLFTGVRKQGETVLCRKSCTNIEFRGRAAILGNVVDVTQEVLLAQQLTASTEQIRVMTERLLAVEEQEKRRVASDLHDSIGQYLNALRMGLQGANFPICQKKTRQGLTEPCIDLLSLTEEAIEEVRRIASDLRPAMLDDLGIVATIGWFCRRFQAQHPTLRIKRRIETGDSAVPENLQIVIFRVLQESLNNAAKYAQADTICVRLAQDQSLTRFSVTDNGRGFDVSATLARGCNMKGFGLMSMRERVSLSGGRFEIQSSPENGTRICASWAF